MPRPPAVTQPAITDPTPSRVRMQLVPARFGDLPGWFEDQHGEAMAAFQGSCDRWTRMDPDRELGNWGVEIRVLYPLCQQARQLSWNDHPVARRFFEANFVPFRIRALPEREAFVTAYFEPILRGSVRPSATYRVPLYRRPGDLIQADLSAFDEKLKGKRVFGRVEGKRFIPYFTREEIDAQGVLRGKGLEILWVDDPVEVFFLHIQGSGRVILEDGRVFRVGYDGKNGHRYASIGRELIRRGELPKNGASADRIRQWVQDNPQKMAELFAVNRSYVFFRPVEVPQELGPLGAMQVPLTSGRSIAIDRDWHPLGVPFWLSLDRGVPTGPLRRLVMGQDTGGVIKGPHRADFFWGSGKEAGRLAGSMTGRGAMWVLIPRAVASRARLAARS